MKLKLINKNDKHILIAAFFTLILFLAAIEIWMVYYAHNSEVKTNRILSSIVKQPGEITIVGFYQGQDPNSDGTGQPVYNIKTVNGQYWSAQNCPSPEPGAEVYFSKWGVVDSDVSTGDKVIVHGAQESSEQNMINLCNSNSYFMKVVWKHPFYTPLLNKI